MQDPIEVLNPLSYRGSGNQSGGYRYHAGLGRRWIIETRALEKRESSKPSATLPGTGAERRPMRRRQFFDRVQIAGVRVKVPIQASRSAWTSGPLTGDFGYRCHILRREDSNCPRDVAWTNEMTRAGVIRRERSFRPPRFLSLCNYRIGSYSNFRVVVHSQAIARSRFEQVGCASVHPSYRTTVAG